MFANVTDSNTATISGLLTGNGDLTKTGTGTLILTNNLNTYRDTNINNGTLVVGDTDPLGSARHQREHRWHSAHPGGDAAELHDSSATSTSMAAPSTRRWAAPIQGSTATWRRLCAM